MLLNGLTDWIEFHNENLRNMYTSLNISRLNKSGRVRLAGQVTRIEEKISAYRVWSWSLRDRHRLENQDIDNCIILE